MPRDRVHEALQKGAASTLRRIRQDGELAPSPQLRKLFFYLEEHLFSPRLNAEGALKGAGILDHSQWLAFSAYARVSLKTYIDRGRLAVAEWMLRFSDIPSGIIGTTVGYSSPTAFGRVYKQMHGKLPSDVRRKPKSSECGFSLWELGERGQLDTPRRADDFLAGAVALNPQLEGSVVRLARSYLPDSQIMVDGAGDDRLRAEGLWSRIRELPPEDQRRHVRCYCFKSTVLFDLLREMSRLEGRKDRQRGIEVAKLALVSLEGAEKYRGDRIHDQLALGYACLGNAYRLAGDLWSAAAAFERCDEEWSHPRAPHESRAAAEVYVSKGTLRIFQRSYDEALDLIGHSRDCSRRAADQHGEARALIQLGTILRYRGELLDSALALGEAIDLIDPGQDRHLAFIACMNLANILARAGRYRSSSEKLEIARRHWRQLDYPLGAHEIAWVHGDIKRGVGDPKAAEELYMGVRAGFLVAEEPRWVGLIGLDLATLHSEAGEWDQAARFVAEAIPILGSIRLYDDTMEALALLSQAIRAGEPSAKLLREVRDTVRRDPLLQMQIREDRDGLPVL